MKYSAPVVLKYKGSVILDTPCYPNRYKVVASNYEDNAAMYFHPTLEAAKQFIDKGEIMKKKLSVAELVANRDRERRKNKPKVHIHVHLHKKVK